MSECVTGIIIREVPTKLSQHGLKEVGAARRWKQEMREQEQTMMLQRKPDFFFFFFFFRKDPFCGTICVSSAALTGLRLDVNFLHLQFSHHLQSRGNTRGDKMQRAESKASDSADTRRESSTTSGQLKDRKKSQGKHSLWRHFIRHFITCSDGRR